MAVKIDFSEYKRFVYRCSPGLQAFSITSDFVYSVTCVGVTQTERHTAHTLTHHTSLSAVKAIVHSDLFFIATSNSLFYFDGCLHLIGACLPLSVSFTTPDYICTISSNSITLFDPAKKMVCREFKIDGVTGLCSAVSVCGNRIFLGYESGKIYSIKISNDLIAPTLIHDFNEPILSITVDNNTVYAALLSSKLVKFQINTSSFKYTSLPAPPKKLLAYKSHLISYESSRILILNEDLKIIAFYISDHSIIDIIIDHTLHIGFSNSLIIEYDIEDLIKKLNIIY